MLTARNQLTHFDRVRAAFQQGRRGIYHGASAKLKYDPLKRKFTMPYYGANKRARTAVKYRRKPKRKARRYIKRRRVPRMLVPQSKVFRMRTTDYQTLGATGAINILKIAANSIADPFIASGAQRPLYYNELKTLYRTAIVLGAKVKVKCHNSGTPAIIFGVTKMPYDYSATIDSWEYAEEVGKTKSRILSNDVDHGYLQIGMGIKNHFRVSNITDGSEYSADIENNGEPSKRAEIFVWAQAMDQTSVWTCDCHVTIDYIVLARDPYIPVRS